jgi:DNA-directed RNA polymerase specialized sigma24 family protein
VLFEALGTLSEIERKVIVAHEFEGVSFRELTLALNIPQNTLLSHKSRAMKKLKEYFSSLESEAI